MISLLPGIFCIVEPKLRIDAWSSVLVMVDFAGVCNRTGAVSAEGAVNGTALPQWHAFLTAAVTSKQVQWF
jgi:hypothetical protein